MNIDTIADFECGCAERPTWDPEQGKLYFTDVDSPALYCFDMETQESEQVYQGEDVVGGLTLNQDGRLLLFMVKGAVRLWSPKGDLETVLEGIKGEEKSRFNDVIADPEGRVFCGTMPTEDREGRLYRLDTDGSLHVILKEAGMPNGMGFSPDLKWFYFTNTNARTIQRFTYHQESGDVTEPKVLVAIPEGEGNPDGLAVDSEGCLWSARYGGHKVVRYSPEGEQLSEIALPMAENPTCPLFAGPELSTMYLTTAGGGYRPQAGTAAGAVLRVTTNTKGKPEYRSRFG